MSASVNQAVFLSYASQDAERALRICEALRAAGVEVWFDQSELRGGDVWDQKIKRQIRECALFLPVISANTNARAEGYFRLEWKLAVERSRLMADDALFLVPVVIDAMPDAEARVPDKFREVQWTRVLSAEAPAAYAARVRSLLAGESKAEPGHESQPAERLASADPLPKSRRATERQHRRFLLSAGVTALVIGLGTLGNTWTGSTTHARASRKLRHAAPSRAPGSVTIYPRPPVDGPPGPGAAGDSSPARRARPPAILVIAQHARLRPLDFRFLARILAPWLPPSNKSPLTR